MSRSNLAIIFMFLSVLVFESARAEEILKHPRVAELEDQISRNATNYLRSRFPDRPFLITVSVDPVRRNEDLASGGLRKTPENLPYMQLDSEEIQDEWDDPRLSLNELMLRSRKIMVNLTLPSSVLDTELEEISSALFSVLHLTKARDEVKLERRAWKEPTPWWAYGLLALSLVLIMLSGSYFINRFAVKRISGALMEARASNVSSASQIQASSGAISEAKLENDGANKDVRFNDPIKVRELLTGLAQQLCSFKVFPTRQDMYDLDILARTKPHVLGTALGFLSEELQKRVFSYSFHPSWLQVMTQPGAPDFASVETLQKIIRNQQNAGDPDWERLVILIWRLDEQCAKFIHHLKQDEAFAILTAMPKTISVKAARKAFPGSWGVILDPAFKPKALSKDRISEISKQAMEVRPLNNFLVIERYKHERELLDYLRTVEINEEREIYAASDKDSMIHKLRPPFFEVLEMPEQLIRDLVPKFNPDQWALALFNVERSERRKIEAYFSEKQMYLIKERWRRFDLSPPERALFGTTREAVAATARNMKATSELAIRTSDDGTAEEKDEKAVAS